MSEPIKDRSEVNEAKEGFGKFVVASGNATLNLDPTEEVFDLMSARVIAAMEAGRLPATAFGRDAATGALGVKAAPEDIGHRRPCRLRLGGRTLGSKGATAC